MITLVAFSVLLGLLGVAHASLPRFSGASWPPSTRHLPNRYL
jgi:hypothetical protein